MQNLKVKMLSVAMAALTAATPILSSYVAYASDITVNDDGTVTQISTSTDEKTDETKFLFVNLKTAGGKVVINEGEDSEQTVRLEKQMDRLHIDVYDKDDVMISSENAIDNGYTYVYEAKADDAVNVKADADDGYVVKLYELTDDSSGTEIAEDVGFDAGNKVEAFKYPVFMEYDKTVKIGFEKKESADDIAKDLSVNDETGKDKAGEQDKADEGNESDAKSGAENDNLTIGDTSVDNSNQQESGDLTVDYANADKDADEGQNDSKNANVPEKSETDEFETKDDADENSNAESSSEDIDEEESKASDLDDETIEELDTDVDSILDDDTIDTVSDINEDDKYNTKSDARELDESNTPGTEVNESEVFDINNQISIDSESGFIDLGSLNDNDFSSQKLLVITDDNSIIREEDVVSGHYGNLYLLQYNSVTDTENAYVYYARYADAAEPDSVLITASEDSDSTEETDIEVDSNAIAALNTEVNVTQAQDMSNVVAVLDTGMQESENVINRVSLIDDNLDGNAHGTEMRDAIVSQNSNAKVLSIKVMDNAGRGSVSSVVAGIEYAIEQGVGVINLSMSAQTTILNKVLEAEIQKAVDKGIIVVAAAGNAGADAKDYMPGSVESAYVIGACNSEGVRLAMSNYGRTVDYNVVANTTSEAAAKFSGCVSAHGINNIDINSGIIYNTSYRKNETAEPDGKHLKVYYLLYDQDKPDIDEYTKDVFSMFNLSYPYEESEDGSIHCKINPDASKYDYNANGIDLDVDIKRGGNNFTQKPITEKCSYDSSTGYIDIPAEYADEDLTVTVWQSRDSAFYKEMIPNEVKPQEDWVEGMTIASFTGLWPGGVVSPAYTAMGCNANLTLKGDVSTLNVGDVYSGTAETWYMQGDVATSEIKPWSYVANASVYRSYHSMGQIFHITKCQNKMFVNVGSPGNYGKGPENWLWGGCVSEICNDFPGKPVCTGIEITVVSKVGNKCTFHLQAWCRGPKGETAQVMAALFTATVEPDSAKLTLKKRFESSQLTQQTSRVGDLVTKFGIFKDKDCEKKQVATIDIDGGKDSKATGSVLLPGGIYYVKELKRISGTIENGKIYGPCKLVNGKNYKLEDFIPANKRADMSMDGNGYILNKPFKFTGKLLTKLKGDTLKPLEGAVFKVNYSEGTGSDYKRKRTWYFVTDKNGEIKYDRKHLADNDARFKGKVPASDEMFTTASNPNKTALPTCELHIKEYLAPAGYAKNNDVHTIVIKALRDNNQKFTDQNAVANNTPTIEDPVAKDYWRVRVQAKKIDENGKGLAGAVFYLYDSEDCSGDRIGKLTSKDDGTTNIETIDEIPQTTKTYEVWCKEVQAPPGYAVLETPIKLTFELSDFKKLSSTNQKNGELKTFGLTDGGKGIVNKKGWNVRIQTKKINRNKTPLAGAKFGIFADDDYKEKLAEIVSGKDGMTDIATLSVPIDKTEITYYCKEIEAPPGKTLNPENKATITFTYAKYKELKDAGDASGELKIFGPKEGFINDDGWPVRVRARKVDGDGNPVAGATFTIYDSESCDNEIGSIISGDDGWTDEASFAYTESDTTVTLYAKETGVPDGYTGDTEKVYSVTFTKEDYDKLSDADKKLGELKSFGDKIVNNTPTPTITMSVTPTPPAPPSGGLYVKKTSKAPKDIMDLKSYTLAGAEYRVTSSRDTSFNTVIKTNEAGYTESVTLPDNSIPRHLDAVYDMKGNLLQEAKDWIEKVQTTYYITEIKAPNYHTVYSGTKSQPVVMPDDAGQTFEIPFENEPIFCDGKLDIEKLGVKGDIIPGAVFKVEYFDADGPNENDLVRTWYLKSDTQGHVRMDESHLDGNNQSDDFFRYDGNIVIPIGGYLQITEIDAPAEYVVETEPVGIPTTKDADFTLTYANNMKPWYEELERCRINLKKYQADGKTPIAGVEFELKFLKQAIKPTSKKHPNFKRLLEEGDSTVRHTDENGDVFFDNLDQGTYQITEIKTLDGNSLLKEPIIVTVPMTMTEDEANEYGNVNYETAKEDKNYSGKWYFYECLYEITNNATFKMPMTGDDGKWKYGFIGLGIVMAISAGFVICNTRNKKAKKRKHKK